MRTVNIMGTVNVMGTVNIMGRVNVIGTVNIMRDSQHYGGNQTSSSFSYHYQWIKFIKSFFLVTKRFLDEKK